MPPFSNGLSFMLLQPRLFNRSFRLESGVACLWRRLSLQNFLGPRNDGCVHHSAVNGYDR
jgi:hypothetical protein